MNKLLFGGLLLAALSAAVIYDFHEFKADYEREKALKARSQPHSTITANASGGMDVSPSEPEWQCEQAKSWTVDGVRYKNPVFCQVSGETDQTGFVRE